MNATVVKYTVRLLLIVAVLAGVMVKCDEPPWDKRFPMVTTAQAVAS